VLRAGAALAFVGAVALLAFGRLQSSDSTAAAA
jgi:hypothetical protein